MNTLTYTLSQAAELLATVQQEQELTSEEVEISLQVYHELHRILPLSTRTDDNFLRPAPPLQNTYTKEDFRHTFVALQQEFLEAEQAQEQIQKENAALVRPLTHGNLSQLNDLFILDNSLRETTVGSARGHTLEEKHKIVDAIAETGIEEVILGAFGSKISVCDQIAARWGKQLGRSFDCTWGFSDGFDLGEFDEEPLWETAREFMEAKRNNQHPLPDYWTPTQEVLTTYSKEDAELFELAAKDFRPDAFMGANRKPKNAKQVLKESEHTTGRVPMGLLMMAGLGISNAIIEVDTSVDTFDYNTFNLVERCQFLMNWCRENFRPRSDGEPVRILINLRDFSNYLRSPDGLEQCLYLVDQLCRLPADERPFGFIMEDPTAWLWPQDVGKLCRMLRLTMTRAGHKQAKFLVHLHKSFGLAEACVQTALCNGADGVWSAVCETGAQVGHASSTVTAVNVYRAGVKNVAKQYNLPKMCQAAREVTEIVTKEECPKYEEVYGKHSFDAAFFMLNVPSCRYAMAGLLEELGFGDRFIRLNEISPRSAIERAMKYHFGEPSKGGWDPKHCTMMHDTIQKQLVSGLSRDYNTPLELGRLYALVSESYLPRPMIETMLELPKASETDNIGEPFGSTSQAHFDDDDDDVEVVRVLDLSKEEQLPLKTKVAFKFNPLGKLRRKAAKRSWARNMKGRKDRKAEATKGVVASNALTRISAAAASSSVMSWLSGEISV